ncbi:hypothetical protein HYDPIDRAFT_40602 [Hydnomerulius pinastri MD-312]|uniref:Uncharacterized protein n=1 Tax=Hydnomerulius pinastri MD-312 TaxID=994086 RepID=A0A0C9WEH0_9AGAM|nr:hypothetical protein HYDPIDRAFT_40602 [Hydnomerulius pinastri MD-312]
MAKGDGKDGKQRPCSRFIPGGGKKGTRCQTCQHKEGYHPATAGGDEVKLSPSPPVQSHALTVHSILNQYSQVQRLQPKTTTQTAHEEAAAGFRKREDGTAESGSARRMITRFSSKSAGAAKLTMAGPGLPRGIGTAKQEKAVKIGSLLMIPDGLDEDGTLIGDRKPSKSTLEHFVQYGLLVREDEGKDLEFLVSWNMDAIDIWLRRLLPKPFQWLDARCGLPLAGEYHWVLLGSDRQRYFVVSRTTTTGKDLDQAKGTTGRKYTTHSVVIAPRRLIPRSAYTDWDNAIARAKAGDVEDEDLGDDLSDNHQARRQQHLKDDIEGLSMLRPASENHAINSVPGRMSTRAATRKAKSILATTSTHNKPDIANRFAESDSDMDLDVEFQLSPSNHHATITQDRKGKGKGKARAVRASSDSPTQRSSSDSESDVEILEGNHMTIARSHIQKSTAQPSIPLFNPDSGSDDGNFFSKLKAREDEEREQGQLDFGFSSGSTAVAETQSAPVSHAMTDLDSREYQPSKRRASVAFEDSMTTEGQHPKRSRQNAEGVQPPSPIAFGSQAPAESISDEAGMSLAPVPTTPGLSYSSSRLPENASTQGPVPALINEEDQSTDRISVPIIPYPHRRASAFKPAAKPLRNPWA